MITKKDKFLEDILGFNCYKISDPIIYLNRESNFINYKKITNEKRFDYVRIPSDKAQLITDFCRLGFRVICQEVEFVRHKCVYNNIKNIDLIKDDFLYMPLPSSKASYLSSKYVRIFEYNRFELDPEFNDLDSRRIRELWIYNILIAKRGSLVYIDNKEAGFISAIYNNVDDNSICRIDLLGILNKFKRKGIGSSLINSLPCKTIYASTTLNNKPALKFYNKLGFKVKGIQTVLHRIMG